MVSAILLGVSAVNPLSAQEADRTGQTSANAAPRFDGPPAPTAPAVLSRDAQGRTTVRAVRVTGPMTVDGILDEPFYQSTQPITELIQGVPVEYGEPTERTEFWISFDDANLYVSARVWDSEGEDGWIANEMRRDSQQLRQNDNIGIWIDTYFDKRNALAFYVTPIGGFADFQITNEGNPNFDWNPVWDVRVGRFDGGWTTELAIPFKSLRYRPGLDQVWGIQLRRSVLRHGEWNYLTPLPLSVVGSGPQGVFRVSLYATLVGVETPPLGRNLEFKPYVVSGLRSDMAANPTLTNDIHGDVGLDVKYAITQNLTADFTVNTDFAQVEVDEQQVNLTRFSLSFPEKREFFLEGRGIFTFGASGGGPGGGGGGGGGGEGRGGGGSAPTLFDSRRIGIQGSTPVPILGGARLTGKVGAFDVGALSIQTADDDDLGAESTNFTVLRLRRDILARSSIGGLFQNRSNSVVADGSSQTFGIDGSFGFTQNLSMIAFYARTETPGVTGNVASYRAQLGYDVDLYGGSVDHLMVGDDFNPEIGLVRRSGFRQTSLSGRFSPRPTSIDWIRQTIFSASGAYLAHEAEHYLESRNFDGSMTMDLERGDGFTTSYRNNYERLVNSERISGALIPAGAYDFNEYMVSYRFGPQRPYQGSVSVEWGSFYTGERLSLGVAQGRIEVTPQMSVEPSLEFNWVDFPEQTEDGQFDQHIARTRLTYTLTPRAYVSGLVQYNTGSESFSGNFRLRWEWAPGSELFVVYTEDRSTDTLDRWSELSNRGLVIKVTRLLRL